MHDEYVADKQLNSSILSCALCYSIFLPKVNNNGLGHKNTRTWSVKIREFILNVFEII